eukprot:332022-Pelagomonas_calceolata.AAC.1
MSSNFPSSKNGESSILQKEKKELHRQQNSTHEEKRLLGARHSVRERKKERKTALAKSGRVH